MNLADIAREIAAAAIDDAKTTGRHCRLQEVPAVEAFLSALHSGKSQRKAATSAGWTEGGVRGWLRWGNAPDGARPYVLFAKAVAAVLEDRQPKPAPIVITSLPDSVVQPARATPARIPTIETLDPYLIHRWKHHKARAIEFQESRAEMARIEGRDLWTALEAEMRAYGVKPHELPDTAPRLNLPPGWRYSAIRQGYIAYCTFVGKPGPRDWEVEQYAMAWYRENMALPYAESA